MQRALGCSRETEESEHLAREDGKQKSSSSIAADVEMRAPEFGGLVMDFVVHDSVLVLKEFAQYYCSALRVAIHSSQVQYHLETCD